MQPTYYDSFSEWLGNILPYYGVYQEMCHMGCYTKLGSSNSTEEMNVLNFISFPFKYRNLNRA